MKKNYFKDDTEQKMYGVILAAKGNSIDFYVEDIQLREVWFNALRKYVVLLDLKEEFKIGEPLGRGNFAKVHVARRRNCNQGVKYALKTMQKG